MRHLATAAVHGALLEAFPSADFTVRGEGVSLKVTIRFPWWIWFFLLPIPIFAYFRAKKIARAKLAELRMASTMFLTVEVE